MVMSKESFWYGLPCGATFLGEWLFFKGLIWSLRKMNQQNEARCECARG